MISGDVMVMNKSGLHARPAAMLVKTASDYKSTVNIEFNGRKGNAKSIIAVLALGVNNGARIKVSVDGEDEQAAFDAIIKLIETMKE
ncbi:MAG: PTS sugar transporter subunit IIA [Clostridia bacterium BRH_c25]|nr:MAG: PTS sugar transporter subunit IIA [Clostridia bacterium BRH_c25]